MTQILVLVAATQIIRKARAPVSATMAGGAIKACISLEGLQLRYKCYRIECFSDYNKSGIR